ncbi:hypothetical protein FD06_GL000313 [Apilactobacillus ozensis DSM 23829 = JCM 17196]|uniref:Replication-associated protein RepC n=1 Tax=Apilactobacillus ozensis DSM 23829 = JCM 17196 TaxID=1423781 RepID=A0A0R2B0B8_9LACO|nr:hypothetical protein [Apilactobacillus ozensis]KRM69254.1 hypothetical protein FD06_GL000313 [Apilactobacillus ozensis DSM 23829 = JCM 17196]
MAKSTMFRKAGNFTPKSSFDEKKIKNTAKKTPKKVEQHRKNIKVSEIQKKSIDAIKMINGLTYDYEVIQLLADKYIAEASDSEKRKYNVFME